MLEEVLVGRSGLDLFNIFKIPKGTVPVAVVMMIVGCTELKLIRVLTNSPQQTIDVLKFLLLARLELIQK